MPTSLQKPPQTPIEHLEKLALSVTRGVGSVWSLIIHTIIFIVSFGLVLFGVSIDRVLLVLTTVLSLEAIYLAIFIQMSVNRNTLAIQDAQKDIEEIADDVEEIAKDVDEIQVDVEEIAEDVEEIQEDMEEIQVDVEHIEEHVDEIQKDVDGIAEDVEEIQEDVDEIQKDVEEIQEEDK